jgi:hypothetical protein
MSLLALHVSSRQRTASVAFGAKRTLTEPRLQTADYEYTDQLLGQQADIFLPAEFSPLQ